MTYSAAAVEPPHRRDRYLSKTSPVSIDATLISYTNDIANLAYSLKPSLEFGPLKKRGLAYGSGCLFFPNERLDHSNNSDHLGNLILGDGDLQVRQIPPLRNARVQSLTEFLKRFEARDIRRMYIANSPIVDES